MEFVCNALPEPTATADVLAQTAARAEEQGLGTRGCIGPLAPSATPRAPGSGDVQEDSAFLAAPSGEALLEVASATA